jgi:hypothetical protein
MPMSPALHQSIRERPEPRISATALAEYLILNADRQETILHDSRFAQASIVAANADAMRALRSYNVDPRRDTSALDRVKAALIARSTDTALRPKRQDEALRCAEIIDLFKLRENALGMRSMALISAPRFDVIDVEGVSVSISPDFLVDGPNETVGAGILRVAKAPDPESCKLKETSERRGEHRREMARYMVALLQMLLEAQEAHRGRVDRNLCFVADVRLGERIGPASNHAARMSTIRGACRQIANLWPAIVPRNSIRKR